MISITQSIFASNILYTCHGFSDMLFKREVKKSAMRSILLFVGAAFKDGRLRPGDQILEVMKEDLRNVSHSFALHALRQTPNKVIVDFTVFQKL